MKKQIKLLMVLPFLLLFVNCTRDNETDFTKNDPPVVSPPRNSEAKINSFSKNYGRKDDVITMYGENFTGNLEYIRLFFDSTPAKIVSATTTEIKFIVPDIIDKQIPLITLTIPRVKVTNAVVNNYNGNIAILGNRTPSSWIVTTSPSENTSVSHFQLLDNGAIYYHTQHTTNINGANSIFDYVYRSLDEGATWKLWASPYAGNIVVPFFATTNDEGWSLYGSSALYKIPVSGGNKGALLFTAPSMIQAISANEDLSKGTVVLLNGTVYQTNDGINFSKVYTSLSDLSLNGTAYILDNDHIWVVGYKGITVNSSFTFKPFILYKKNSSEGWKEKFFSDEPKDISIKQIQFIDANSGLLLIADRDSSKIYKTNDGGDNWNVLYDGNNFSSFAFKDASTGWAVLKNVIYKTTNGGTSWSIEYTHDEDILKLAYNDNIIWGISKTKILKRYL